MMAGTRRLGWQTTIADLALILFMVTAAAMAEKPDNAGETRQALPLEAEPIALYRSAANAPPLAQWLATQPRDGRQHLTILARHAPGEAPVAAATALALADQARAAGREPRVMIEPANLTDVTAVLSYDGRRDWHADCNTGATDARKDLPCE